MNFELQGSINDEYVEMVMAELLADQTTQLTVRKYFLAMKYAMYYCVHKLTKAFVDMFGKKPLSQNIEL